MWFKQGPLWSGLTVWSQLKDPVERLGAMEIPIQALIFDFFWLRAGLPRTWQPTKTVP